MNKRSITIGIFVIICGLFSCQNQETKTPYEQLLEQESKSNEIVDSLFFDIKLGMTAADFYQYCKENNQTGVFKEGPSNMSVNYVFELNGKEVNMNFYPEFTDKKIGLMTVEYIYRSWAPWAKEFSAKILMTDILQKFKQDYGDDFIQEKDARGKDIFIDVDANRKILVEESLDGARVKAIFTDLRTIKE